MPSKNYRSNTRIAVGDVMDVMAVRPHIEDECEAQTQIRDETQRTLPQGIR